MKKIYASIACIVAFFALGLGVANNIAHVHTVDVVVANFFSDIRTEHGVQFMSVVTQLGEAPSLFFAVALLLGLLLYARRSKLIVLLVFGMIFTNIATRAIKELFSVDRPDELFSSTYGYAYPSGHVSGTAIIFIVAIIATHVLVRQKNLRISLYVLSGLWIVAVAVSRLYLNVHWFTDVVGGVLLPLAIAFLIQGVLLLLESRNFFRR